MHNPSLPFLGVPENIPVQHTLKTVTSLNKESRPFSLGDNSMGKVARRGEETGLTSWCALGPQGSPNADKLSKDPS